MTTALGAFDGQVVLITGAARGQGAAHAQLLSERGAAVVLVDGPGPVPSAKYPMGTATQVTEVAAAICAAGGNAISIEGDVRNQDDLDGAVAEAIRVFGKVDCLIANAGIWGDVLPLWETPEADWVESININLMGCWRSIKAVAPAMIDNGKGSIVVVSSVMGFGEGMALSSAYSASKHGMLGLMMTAALELGPHNIRVNAVCPGFIDTDMHRWQRAMDYMAGHPGGTEEDLERAGHYYSNLKGRGPLDSLDVARAVAFLLSDEARHLTGVNMPVDAGHTVLPRVNQNPVY